MSKTKASLLSCFFVFIFMSAIFSPCVSYTQASANGKNKNNEFVANGDFESGEKLPGWNKTVISNGDVFIAEDAEHGKVLCMQNGDLYSKCLISQAVTLNQKTAKPIVLKGYSRPEQNINETNLVKVFYSAIVEGITYNDNTKNTLTHYVSYDSGNPGWQFGSYVIIPDKPIKSAVVRCQWANMQGKVSFDSVALGYFPYLERDLSVNVKNSNCIVNASINNPSENNSFKVKLIVKSWDGGTEKKIAESSMFLIEPDKSIPVELQFILPAEDIKMFFFDVADDSTGEIYFRSKSAYHGSTEIKGNMLCEKNGLQIAEVSPDTRIYQQAKFSGQPIDAVSVSGAKREYESVQLGINLPEKKNLDISFSSFVNADGKQLNMTKSTVSYVEFVQVKYTTSGYIPDIYPDKLMPLTDRKITLDKGASALWLTFFIPGDTQAGKYSGYLNINGDIQLKIPVTILVYNFSMPGKRNFTIHPCTSRSDFSKYMPDAFSKGTLKDNLYRNFEEHFCDYIDNWISATITSKDGKNTITDVAKVDSELKTFNKYKFDWIRLNLPFFGNAGGIDKEWQGCKIPSKEFEALFTDYSRHLAALINKHCPDKKIYYKSYDEPKDLEHLKYLCDLARKAVPGVQIFSTARLNTENEYEHLKDLIDIFCPHIIYLNRSMEENLDKISKDNTKKLSLYHNHLLFTDYPRVNARMLPWVVRKYKADTGLLWSINAWKNLDAPQGNTAIYQYTEGILIYPGKDKVLNSIRWELIREGAEDFEYLHLLEKIVPELKKYPDLYLKGTQLLKSADKMVSNWQTFSKDYSSVQGLHLAIGDFINEVSGKAELNEILMKPKNP